MKKLIAMVIASAFIAGCASNNPPPPPASAGAASHAMGGKLGGKLGK